MDHKEELWLDFKELLDTILFSLPLFGAVFWLYTILPPDAKEIRNQKEYVKPSELEIKTQDVNGKGTLLDIGGDSYLLRCDPETMKYKLVPYEKDSQNKEYNPND